MIIYTKFPLTVQPQEKALFMIHIKKQEPFFLFYPTPLTITDKITFFSKKMHFIINYRYHCSSF